MTRIIGLSGPIRVGKSTVAHHMTLKLAVQNKTAIRVSFAQPMREMMTALFDYVGIKNPRAYLSDQDMKRTPIDGLCGATPRHLMQTLGTEWGRTCIADDLWVEIGINVALNSGADFAIIDDVRFPNEVAAIEKNNGKVVGLTRSGVEFDTSHPSEQSLDVGVVSNDGHPFDTVASIFDMVATLSEDTK